MIKIAICDDHNAICSQVETYVINICKDLRIKCEIDVYYSGERLCQQLEKGEIYELIFLDIEMGETNGVEVGRKIRDEYNNESLQIVYISGKTEYALDLFKVRPLDFIIKPLNKEKIESIINKYFKLTNLWSDVFTYKIKYDTFKVKLKNIKYLESDGRKVKIHLIDRTDEIYSSLEDIYNNHFKKYECFIYPHNSYIVNYEYVSIFEYENLFLHDGTKIPIAQSKRKEIRNIHKNLDKERK